MQTWNSLLTMRAIGSREKNTILARTKPVFVLLICHTKEDPLQHSCKNRWSWLLTWRANFNLVIWDKGSLSSKKFLDKNQHSPGTPWLSYQGSWSKPVPCYFMQLKVVFYCLVYSCTLQHPAFCELKASRCWSPCSHIFKSPKIHFKIFFWSAVYELAQYISLGFMHLHLHAFALDIRWGHSVLWDLISTDFGEGA